jgi:hypothetical protein
VTRYKQKIRWQWGVDSIELADSTASEESNLLANLIHRVQKAGLVTIIRPLTQPLVRLAQNDAREIETLGNAGNLFSAFCHPIRTASNTVRSCSPILLGKRQDLMRNFSSFEVLPKDFPLPAERKA